MKNRACLSATLLLLANLSGCAGTAKGPAPVDPVLLALEQTAEEISQETIMVREMMQGQELESFSPDISDPVLTEPMTVLDYAGDAERILQRISDNIDYSFFASENTGKFRNTVLVSADSSPVINVLRDIAAQLGNTVLVTVDVKQKAIRLEYL